MWSVLLPGKRERHCTLLIRECRFIRDLTDRLRLLLLCPDLFFTIPLVCRAVPAVGVLQHPGRLHQDFNTVHESPGFTRQPKLLRLNTPRSFDQISCLRRCPLTINQTTLRYSQCWTLHCA